MANILKMLDSEILEVSGIIDTYFLIWSAKVFEFVSPLVTTRQTSSFAIKWSTAEDMHAMDFPEPSSWFSMMDTYGVCGAMNLLTNSWCGYKPSSLSRIENSKRLE